METAGKDEPHTNPKDDLDIEEDDDKEECGWCRWMKAGGCKAEFQVWLDCVDGVKAAGRDDVESCSAVMGPLWDCMERRRDYYAPQLESLTDRKKTAGEDGDGNEGKGATAQAGGAAAQGGTAGADVAESSGSGKYTDKGQMEAWTTGAAGSEATGVSSGRDAGGKGPSGR